MPALRVIATFLFLLFSPLPAVATPLVPPLPVEEYVLSNGMRLLLCERHDEPSVSAGWVAHVGSVNEPPGKSGASHLIEHMLFKGSTTVGVVPGQAGKEAALMAEEEQIQQQIRGQEARLRRQLGLMGKEDLIPQEVRTPRLQTLDARLAALSARQRPLTLTNEFHRIYAAAGATELNAHTMADMTTFFVTLPRNKLELWFWMESERLLHPVFRGFYPERDVILEERRKRIDSTPLGLQQEIFHARFFGSTPYAVPTAGWPAEILSLGRKDVEVYFRRHYTPRNLTAVLVGDFDPAEALALARRYLARLPSKNPAGSADASKNIRWDSWDKRPGNAIDRFEAETPPRLWLQFHTVGFRQADSWALQVAAQLLTGPAGRLHLIVRLNLGTRFEVRQVSSRHTGVFTVDAEGAPDHPALGLLRVIDEELARLSREPVDRWELGQAKNQLAFSALRRLAGNQEILTELLESDGLGSWREVNEAPRRIEEVTSADVLRVAQKYLRPDNRMTALVTRRGAAK